MKYIYTNMRSMGNKLEGTVQQEDYTSCPSWKRGGMTNNWSAATDGTNCLEGTGQEEEAKQSSPVCQGAFSLFEAQ